MPVWFHEVLTPLMMLMVFALNIFASYHRADKKSAQEAQRLEGVFIQELDALAALYRENIKLCERTDHVLLSLKSSINIFRANLGRLSTIDADVARHLVSIHTRNEHVEMLMSARAKSIRGGVVTTYLFEPGSTVAAEIQNLLKTNLQEIDAVVSAYNTWREVSDQVNAAKGGEAFASHTSATPLS